VSSEAVEGIAAAQSCGGIPVCHRHSFLLPFFCGALGLFLLVRPFGASAATGKNTQRAAAGLSHVRVVRLSFLQGTATIRMPGSDKWTEAVVNTPIQEGFVIATEKGSFLEVEFENGSTVRLGERSELNFTQLALAGDGGQINHMSLEHGYATFKVMTKLNDEFSVSAGGVNLKPDGKTEFRTDLDQNQMRVEVFGGRVTAADSSQQATLGKNHGLVHESGDRSAFQVSDGIKKDDWDKWAEATKASEAQSSPASQEEEQRAAALKLAEDELQACPIGLRCGR
jgi:ferric-dicitrate binding protein FerR (iron transport regulator)